MIYSTLFSVPHALTDGLITVENGTTAVVYVVGVMPNGDTVCHGEPGEPIPTDATVYRDGSVAWTWNELVAEYPDLAPVVLPHEYAGEPTAADLQIAAFSRTVPPLEEM